MATEFEIKYTATAEILNDIAARFPGGTAISMTTTYYDTKDGALSMRKWTLRHRQEGSDQVCTLKTPGCDGITRGEWECNCQQITDAIVPLARASGLSQLIALTEGGLIATCGAKFQRIAIPVQIGESSAEIALDQGVLTGGGRSIPLCECEVELKSGNREDILTFAADLAEKYHLKQELRSKFGRAKALAQEG